MNYSFFIGTDISKLMIDYCIIDQQGTILKQGQVKNQAESIKKWIKKLSDELGKRFWGRTLLCMEHSGYYGTPLAQTLHQSTKAVIWMESALQIKRSIGVQRGKNDKVDAERIAAYCLDFQRKAKAWRPSKQSIERLNLLLSHRDRMVKYLMSMRNTLNEEAGFIDQQLHEEMKELSKETLGSLQQTVANFDDRIDQLLSADQQLARQAKIVKSLPGFGPVIAPKIIAATRGFTRLTDPKKLACFAGVAPFEHRSGTSLKGKTRVSHLANKDIKKMLHLAALVTIRKGNIMHDYYQRKVSEGKNKMAVINAVRNKLIHILLACIKNDTIYQKNYHHSLA